MRRGEGLFDQRRLSPPRGRRWPGRDGPKAGLRYRTRRPPAIARRPRRSGERPAMPKSRANARAFASVREQTRTGAPPSEPRRPSTNLRAAYPAPMIPQRNTDRPLFSPGRAHRADGVNGAPPALAAPPTDSMLVHPHEPALDRPPDPGRLFHRRIVELRRQRLGPAARSARNWSSAGSNCRQVPRSGSRWSVRSDAG